MIDEKKLIEDLETTISDVPISYVIDENHDRLNAYLDALTRVILNVKNQPKVGEWIPVEEGLPKFYKNVQVTYLGYEDNKLYSDGVAYIDDCGVWRWEFDESKVECGITAWMPLPEPYAKGDVEE